MNLSIKRLLCLLAGIIAMTNISFGQKMDLDKCKRLIEAYQTADYLLPQQYDELIAQCRILSNRYLKATEEIKQLNTIEEREVAAESVNAQCKDEYDAYASMLRILRSAVESEDAIKILGRLNRAEAEHLISDDRYINRMFTIFRSRLSYR